MTQLPVEVDPDDRWIVHRLNRVETLTTVSTTITPGFGVAPAMDFPTVDTDKMWVLEKLAVVVSFSTPTAGGDVTKLQLGPTLLTVDDRTTTSAGSVVADAIPPGWATVGTTQWIAAYASPTPLRVPAQHRLSALPTMTVPTPTNALILLRATFTVLRRNKRA